MVVLGGGGLFLLSEVPLKTRVHSLNEMLGVRYKFVNSGTGKSPGWTIR